MSGTIPCWLLPRFYPGEARVPERALLMPLERSNGLGPRPHVHLHELVLERDQRGGATWGHAAAATAAAALPLLVSLLLLLPLLLPVGPCLCCLGLFPCRCRWGRRVGDQVRVAVGDGVGPLRVKVERPRLPRGNAQWRVEGDALQRPRGILLCRESGYMIKKVILQKIIQCVSYVSTPPLTD
jgi:hypothetical protein